MASFTLKVTPEMLEKKADDFWKIIENIDGHFRQIENIASRTRGYWQGEAADAGRAGYDSYKTDIAYILKRLDEHPSDLLKMAGIYKKAERGNMVANERLKTDMIV